MSENQVINNLARLQQKLLSADRPVICSGFSGSDRACLLSRIYRDNPREMLIVTPTNGEAERFAEDLEFFNTGNPAPVLLFPSYNILPFKLLAYHSETAARRIHSLHRILSADLPPIVVTPVEALLQKIIPKKEMVDFAELLVAGEEVDRDQLVAKLASGGYERAVLVEEPGDYAVRGSILDIFSPGHPHPLRAEFFGDMLESLRFFSAVDQRRIDTVTEAVVLPAKEVILHAGQLDTIIYRLRNRAAEQGLPVTQVRRLTEQIGQQHGFAGIESLISLIYEKLDLLIDYFSDDPLVVFSDRTEVQKAALEFEKFCADNFTASEADAKICVPPDHLYTPWASAKKHFDRLNPLYFQMVDILPAGSPGSLPAIRFNADIQSELDVGVGRETGRKSTNPLRPLADWLENQLSQERLTLVVCQTEIQARRLTELMEPYGVRFQPGRGFPASPGSTADPFICLGKLSGGFVWPGEGLAVITEDAIFGVRHHRKQKPRSKTAGPLLELQELKTGDLVVHQDHGIGSYQGLVKLNVDHIGNDYIKVAYHGGDILYVPVDRLGLVQKYMGVDAVTPSLDRLGGKSWERVKARVKRSAEKIAGELLKLYARRKVDRGYAFGDAGGLLRDFEAAFPYEETTDQIKAIDDVVADMQQPVPMDRLVCGDVGYGKTEVALRASFLAANSQKQVAVLVPTTILAEQHYDTFCQRFRRYPVSIACLSRFRSSAAQRQIVEDVGEGKIDIVIGTHRLLQKDIKFKNLGLLIIDEEQRFGVRHKEKLKKFRSSVDVLALTATPIPRTLHLSLTGIRDISMIATPPEYRKSIITYISEFEEALVAEAIRRELRRGGQIFFVHNNIRSIDRMARRLQRLVPEVSTAVAHGQMTESELEQIMLGFIAREIDLLVCTTIIESGLDIPSANTIIVNRADRFGLAQMYQLRGRVGRADEQAYAYLLIPPESMLTRDAQKRLKVLMEHSDLGSGFQIAMNDLRIRGGGTILGASQSGHIAAVGYDMFLKLMESAISEVKGRPVTEPLDPEINVNLSAFLSESYIPDIDQRMLMYRRLARMTELEEIDELKAELLDRFGPMPHEAKHLLMKITVKVFARKAAVSRLDLKNGTLHLYFSEAHLRQPERLIDLIMSAGDRFELSPDQVLKVDLARTGAGGRLSKTKNILKEIAERVNS